MMEILKNIKTTIENCRNYGRKGEFREQNGKTEEWE